ncbi:MAG: tryptophan 2,3-dioxygenase [Alphaproteobacteria bacterium]
MKQDFSKDMSYGDYLNLNKLLSLQTPLSDHHDEMLFIIIHHASELWIKLAEHELAAAMKDIENDNVEQALKKLSRISRIQENLIQSWSILSTLTPADYLEFRDDLGNSSGFQSYGYRSLEFMLGNKNEKMLNVHKHDKEVYAKLKTILDAPSVYELVLQKLSQHFPIDDEVINRDFSKPYVANESVLNAWMKVYQESEKYWQFYAIAEKLVDIEDTFQNWRFRHLSTVKRIIGFKTGTGGSSGVGFLEKALEINFFPELFDVRTEL